MRKVVKRMFYILLALSVASPWVIKDIKDQYILLALMRIVVVIIATTIFMEVKQIGEAKN